MKRRRTLKQFRRMQRNLLHDRQVIEDIFDDMATKWAIRAEALNAKPLVVSSNKKLS
ncbi:MAG: hypothetical protein NT111_00205 [Patescibacteria group bacterium]|nr:hypothetical protein [Patescibacteria group bacterium]